MWQIRILKLGLFLLGKRERYQIFSIQNKLNEKKSNLINVTNNNNGFGNVATNNMQTINVFVDNRWDTSTTSEGTIKYLREEIGRAHV